MPKKQKDVKNMPRNGAPKESPATALASRNGAPKESPATALASGNGAPEKSQTPKRLTNSSNTSKSRQGPTKEKEAKRQATRQAVAKESPPTLISTYEQVMEGLVPGIGIDTLQAAIHQRLKELHDGLEIIEKSKENEPKGNLRMNMCHGSYQYFQVTSPTDPRGRYIKKKDANLIKSLAQKSYNSKIEVSILQEIQALNNLLQIQENSPETIFRKLTKERKSLVNPLFIDNELYKYLWLAQPFSSNPYYPEELIYETDRGEFVRSKSEMDIANAYFKLKIPYRYEARLDLLYGRYKFPDFTVLDVKRKRLVYHEHLGILDHDEYLKKNLKKLELYQNSGIYMDKNLIITFETQEVHFNIVRIRKMLEDIFC